MVQGAGVPMRTPRFLAAQRAVLEVENGVSRASPSLARQDGL